MARLAMVDIDKRLNRLLKVIEWVETDVTASFDEKLSATCNKAVVSSIVVQNLSGTLKKEDLAFANSIWNGYVSALTGSNVPLYIKRIVEGR